CKWVLVTLLSVTEPPIDGRNPHMSDLAPTAGDTAERESPDRLSLRLTPEARKTLEEISTLRGGVSFAEVVRRALGTELYLIKEQRDGGRILVEGPDKAVRQIVLR